MYIKHVYVYFTVTEKKVITKVNSTFYFLLEILSRIVYVCVMGTTASRINTVEKLTGKLGRVVCAAVSHRETVKNDIRIDLRL